ncbi:MAG: RNA methyltransferase [Rhizobacter sp.]|nr:RNA methyltransferase [Ferruginibacter sp.]
MAEQLPPELINSLQTATGFDETAFRDVHGSGSQVVSVRLNPAKVSNPSQIPFLENILAEKIPWNTNGYYLKQRPIFTIDPLFHAGAYYVQEASSMFLEEAIKQSCDMQQNLRVLDLCAAPGGKSTLIQSVISESSLLVSNEVIKNRANILVENITKWGAANVVVTNNDPKDFKKLPAFFDCIIVDAPCSGSGLFRKDPTAITEWSLNNVELCSQRQQRILADIFDCLKPGGVLIYSTCSYSTEEDESIADWLKDNYEVSNIRLQIKKEWGIVETLSDKHQCYGYRFYPDKVKGEGFFIAVFRKETEAVEPWKEKRPNIKNGLPSKSDEQAALRYLDPGKAYDFLKWQKDMLAIPAAVYDAVLFVQQNLYIKKAGINMGSIIRDQLVPDHEWVLSTIANIVFPFIEVDEATALDFLRRKDIYIDTEKHGWSVITYGNTALGLVKILSNRVNNYYPKDWRILNK